MQSFGFKIVEKSVQDIKPILHRAADDHRPLEIGLYFGDRRALSYLDAELPSSGVPLNTHLDHDRFNVFDIDSELDGFKRQLEQSVKWGAKYAITHVSREPMTVRLEYRTRLMDRLLANTQLMDEICGEFGFALHIENTFHQLDFYQEYFAAVGRAEISRIHHCFDIGHAKVWSTASLSDWLDLLDRLSDDGLRLHFHLHANQGLADDHLSFLRAEELGITGADSYTSEHDYFKRLGEIALRFPDSVKVFEVPATEALANMDLVIDRLSMEA